MSQWLFVLLVVILPIMALDGLVDFVRGAGVSWVYLAATAGVAELFLLHERRKGNL
jgi:hypothetical protein